MKSERFLMAALFVAAAALWMEPRQAEGAELVRQTAGFGEVQADPEGREFPFGTEVTLTAIPDENYLFSRWWDGTTANPRTITIGERNRFTAVFEPASPVETRFFEQGQHVFGTESFDQLDSIEATSDGGYLLGGFAGDGGGGNLDAPRFGESDGWLIKLDARGQKEWDATFGGQEPDAIRLVRQTQDGGFILGLFTMSDATGNKETQGFGNRDLWIVKTDAEGNKQWEKTFGSTKDDELAGLDQTGDGGFVVLAEIQEALPGGNREAEGFGENDFWVIRLDGDGNRLWETVVGGVGHDVPHAVLPTADGGYLVGGNSNSEISGSKGAPQIGQRDYWLVKLNAEGEVLWDKTYGGESFDALSSIAPVRGGGFLLGGSSRSPSGAGKTADQYGGQDYWLVRIDSQGEPIWDRSFGGESNEFLETVKPTPVGGFILGGGSESPPSGNKTTEAFGSGPDFWVVKVDNVGNLIWDKSYGSSEADDFAGIVSSGPNQYAVGGAIDEAVGGNVNVEGFGNDDFWLVRFAARTGPLGAPVVYGNGEPIFGRNVTFTKDVTVTLDSSFEDANLFYTLDQSVPRVTGTPYDGPFELSRSSVLRVGAYRSDYSAFVEIDPIEIDVGRLLRLTTQTQGQGEIRANPDRDTYREGTLVRLQARAAQGWRFSHWSGAIQGERATIDLLVDRDKSVTAHFIPLWELNVTSGYGGEVFIDPPKSAYPDGSIVTLLAEPEPHFRFLGWGGDLSGDANPLTLTLHQDKIAHARFGLTQLTIEQFGEGTITRSPSRADYAVGEAVTLRASPPERFVEWGDGSTDPVRTITIGTDNFFQARFEGEETGKGLVVRVEGEPPASDSIELLQGTTVTLENRIDPQGPIFYTLDGSPPTPEGHLYTGPFEVTETATLRARAYGADFARGSQFGPLEIVVQPGFQIETKIVGEGGVSLEPPMPFYASNTVVQVTAQPEAGWGFASWEGDVQSGENPLEVTVNRNLHLKARFAPAITLETKSFGQGSIRQTPDRAPYLVGSTTELEAVPSEESVFVGWDGDLTSHSTNNPFQVTLTESSRITAHFTSKPEEGPLRPGALPRQEFWMTDGEVHDLLATNGVVYLGGEFELVTPHPGGGSVMLDYGTGEIDPEWPLVEGKINAAVSDGEGGWFLGGKFDSVGEVACKNLAHLNPDMSVDPDFKPNPNDEVFTLSRSDRLLFVGGRFNEIGGASRQSLAKLSLPEGQVAAWDPNPDGFVFSLEATTEALYVGGSFDQIGQRGRSHLAALDPATGRATEWSPAPDGSVDDILVTYETVYIGGLFSRIDETTRPFLAGIDRQTGDLLPWNPAPDRPVRALARQEGLLYAAGEFKEIGGANRPGVAAISLSGGAATDWSPEFEGASTARAVGVRDGVVYIGGRFHKINGERRDGVAALDAETGENAGWSPTVKGAVMSLTVAEAGVLIGGNLLAVNGVERSRLAALDAKSGAPVDWAPEADGAVTALAYHDGSIYLGGRFGAVNGIQRQRLAAVNAETGELSDWNPQPEGESVTVNVLRMIDTSLYMGGEFSQIGGSERQNLAVLDPETGAATERAWGTNGEVTALEHHGPYVFVAGRFNELGGKNRGHLAAISVDSGELLPWSLRINGPPLSLWASGNRLYIGGDFSHINGTEHPYLAALYTVTGKVAEALPSPDGIVTELTGWESTLYLGGGFDGVGEEARTGLAAIDAQAGEVLAWGPALTLGSSGAPVTGLARSEDLIWISGRFSGVDESLRSRLAAFPLPRSLYSARLERLPSSPNAFIRIRVQGTSGWRYVLQRSSDLVNWTRVKSGLVPFVFEGNPSPAEDRQFYRAVPIEQRP